jgi:hypothetical protein
MRAKVVRVELAMVEVEEAAPVVQAGAMYVALARESFPMLGWEAEESPAAVAATDDQEVIQDAGVEAAMGFPF